MLALDKEIVNKLGVIPAQAGILQVWSVKTSLLQPPTFNPPHNFLP